MYFTHHIGFIHCFNVIQPWEAWWLLGVFILFSAFVVSLARKQQKYDEGDIEVREGGHLFIERDVFMLEKPLGEPIGKGTTLGKSPNFIPIIMIFLIGCLSIYHFTYDKAPSVYEGVAQDYSGWAMNAPPCIGCYISEDETATLKPDTEERK